MCNKKAACRGPSEVKGSEKIKQTMMFCMIENKVDPGDLETERKREIEKL